MGLEIDPAQIEAFKRFARATSKDPIRMRVVVSVAAMLLGYVAIIAPLSSSLRTARAGSATIRERVDMASDLAFVLEQREDYRPRLTGPIDNVSWQTYLLSLIERAGVSLVTLEPFRRDTFGPFVTLDVDLVATAETYHQAVDFVDLLERGERPTRVVHFKIERHNDSIKLSCSLHALILEEEIDAEGYEDDDDAADGTRGDAAEDAGADVDADADADANTDANTDARRSGSEDDG